MARPIALRALVTMSEPGRGVTLWNESGPVTDQPEWVSLDVLVQVQLDSGEIVARRDPSFGRGGPLDFSRRELEVAIRDLIFSEPRYLPGDPRAEPAQLVSELRNHGVDTTMADLAALPLTVIVSDEVEAERVAQASQ
jgi:hypothetical protein